MSEKKPTLEELLSLKRCERPTEEEWARFDEQLKSKMIRKLQRKQPTLELPFKRMLAPFGAAAVLTAIIFTPDNFFNGDDSEIGQSADFFGDAISKTPLPSVGYSFSSNEIPSFASGSSEIPVVVPMNTQQDSSVRYVSNGMSQAFDNVIF